MYYLCTYKLIVYSNYYRRKGRSSYSCLFYVLTVYDCINTVSCAGLHGSKRLLSNRVTVIRRLLRDQKTVYDLKLLVIFFKKSVMFFKKLVMFYQSLAALCCFPVYPLIIYKSALDKICLIQDVKGCICKISSAYPLYSCCWEKKNDSLSIPLASDIIFSAITSKSENIGTTPGRKMTAAIHSDKKINHPLISKQ